MGPYPHLPYVVMNKEHRQSTANTIRIAEVLEQIVMSEFHITHEMRKN
jgi:hypothetical protein